MKFEKKRDCVLDILNARAEYCPPGSCEGCGWNLQEDARRAGLLASRGLTRCSDGLYRLIIHRER